MKKPFSRIIRCMCKYYSSKFNEKILRPPLYLIATPGNSAVHILFWENGNVGNKIDNYQYSLDSGKTYMSFNPPQTSSPIIISGLTNGITYNIALRGINNFGNGTPSSIVTVMPMKR